MNRLRLQTANVFAKFFKLMLKNGINLAPSKYEAWFLTIAHTEKDIMDTLVAVDNSFKELATRKRLTHGIVKVQ